MKKRTTDHLQQELMDSPDLARFLTKNENLFVNKSIAELLNQLFERKNISKAALAKQSGEYYGAAEPPVRCGESHLSGLTEPPHFVY